MLVELKKRYIYIYIFHTNDTIKITGKIDWSRINIQFKFGYNVEFSKLYISSLKFLNLKLFIYN